MFPQRKSDSSTAEESDNSYLVIRPLLHSPLHHFVPVHAHSLHVPVFWTPRLQVYRFESQVGPAHELLSYVLDAMSTVFEHIGNLVSWPADWG